MVSTDIRICFVGDSFVNGTCDPDYLGWTGRVCRAARQVGYALTSYNLGVRRDTSIDITKRWHDECLRRLPSPCDGRIVFSFGVNDTSRENGVSRVSTEQSLINAREILSTSVSLYPTLMVGPPPIADSDQNRRTQSLAEQFRIVAEEVGVPYLDAFSTLERSATWMHEVALLDGAHPQSKGYAELASLVQTWSAWWFRAKS
jgi:lysophospholipase L1-like esterase